MVSTKQDEAAADHEMAMATPSSPSSAIAPVEYSQPTRRAYPLGDPSFANPSSSTVFATGHDYAVARGNGDFGHPLASGGYDNINSQNNTTDFDYSAPAQPGPGPENGISHSFNTGDTYDNMGIEGMALAPCLYEALNQSPPAGYGRPAQ